MESFCGFCGKKLMAGEMCGCTESSNQRVAPAQTEQYPTMPPQSQQPSGQPVYPPMPPQQSAYPPIPPQGQAYYQQPYMAPPVPKTNRLASFMKGFFSSPAKASADILSGPKLSSAYQVGLVGLGVNILYILLFFNRAIASLSSFAAKSLSIGQSYYSVQSPDYLLVGIFAEFFEDMEYMLDQRYDITIRQFFSEVSLPYLGFAASVLIPTAVGILLVALIWMLMGSVAKRPLGFQQSLASVCVASHASTIFMAIAALLLFINVKMSLLCVAVAVITFCVSSCSMLKSQLSASSGKEQYLYGLLFFIVYLICYTILIRMMASQIMEISWRGTSITQAVGGNLSYIWQEIMGNLF